MERNDDNVQIKGMDKVYKIHCRKGEGKRGLKKKNKYGKRQRRK